MTAPHDTGDLFVRDGQAGLVASRAFVYDLGRAIEDGDDPEDIADWIAVRLDVDENRSGAGVADEEHDPFCDCDCDCCESAATAPRTKVVDPRDPEIERKLGALDRLERATGVTVTEYVETMSPEKVTAPTLHAALDLVRHLRKYPLGGFPRDVADLAKSVDQLTQAVPLVTALVAAANGHTDAAARRDALDGGTSA